MANPIPPASLPSDPVDTALLRAQAEGKPKLDEMIYVLDNLIADRCVSMRVWAKLNVDSLDWLTWRRNTYVLEELLVLLRRMDSDEGIKRYLRGKLREQARHGHANQSQSSEEAGDSTDDATQDGN